MTNGGIHAIMGSRVTLVVMQRLSTLKENGCLTTDIPDVMEGHDKSCSSSRHEMWSHVGGKPLRDD